MLYRVIFIAMKTNYWVYPVLGILNWGYRLVFFAFLMIFAAINYLLVEKLSGIIWGKKYEQFLDNL